MVANPDRKAPPKTMTQMFRQLGEERRKVNID
jgi:hypothetical protein